MKMLRNKKIGVIGMGNMGASILEGVLARRLATSSHIWVYDVAEPRARTFARHHGVRLALSVAELLKNTDIVLLAMKPQDFALFAAENRICFKPGQIVISILAGMTTEKISKAIGKNVVVVRAMPNLGAKVGHSMTVVCGKNKTALSFAEKLFAGCGEVVTLQEKRLDLVTAISGSGPAYLFLFAEAFLEAAIKIGMDAKTAKILVYNTLSGGAKLMSASKDTPAMLRQKVTSPNGTTAAALAVFESRDFKKIVLHAVEAAKKRSEEMTK